MRSGALSSLVAGALLLCVLAPRASHAHLALGDRSLLHSVAAAQGMAVASTLAPTEIGSRDDDRHPANTSFGPCERLAGRVPEGPFLIAGARPALRYAAGVRAVVLLGAQDDAAWRSEQVAGMALPLDGEELSLAGRSGLVALWWATHSEQGDVDVRQAAAALLRLTRAREIKLRALAALDIAGIAQDPAAFDAENRAMLADLLEDRTVDATIRPVLEIAFRMLAPASATVVNRGGRS